VPASAPLNFPVVDVRDVAAAHITAMTVPQAAGKRFLCASESASMRQIAAILHQQYPERRVPLGELPKWLAWLFSYVDPTLRTVRDEIGKTMRFDNTRIKQTLQWQPRSLPDMVLSMAVTLIAHGYA
jgi:dihydroflavonol-4-reductase